MQGAPMSDTLRERLQAMTIKLAALERTVAEESQRKRLLEEKRLQEIAASVADIENQLSEEIRARVEAMQEVQKSAQAILDEKSQTIQEDIRQSFHGPMTALQDLSSRLDVFDAALHHDTSPSHPSPLLSSVEEKLEALKQDTSMLRENFESTLLPDVDDSLKRCVRELRDIRRRLNTTVEKDISDFQEALGEIRQKCAQTNQEADESNTTYKIYIPQEICAFKQAIKQEATIREETDDAMVKALNEYNIALRKGFSTFAPS